MGCPKHGKLIKARNNFSLMCPHCDYKIVNPRKFWLPEMRYVIDLPSASAWSNWTMVDVEDSGGSLVLSSGKISGSAVSAQIINLTRNTERYYDCTKVKLDWTQVLNNGTIEYFASNDSGDGYRLIRKADANYQLNHGQEQPVYKQAKYNDLRIKITLSRTLASDSSPSVSRVVVTHDKKKL